MKTMTLIVALLVGFAFVAAPGSAEHCNGNVTALDAGADTIYIDDRADDPNAPPGSGFIFGPGGTWIYLESNNVDGLQSGGTAQPELPGFINTDPCDHPEPDTILF